MTEPTKDVTHAFASTRRNTVPAVEELLYRAIPVLDHGFVRVIDYMGDDEAIVQAARVSYGRGTKTRQDDRALIRYLLRHRHTSPFEMCEIKLHVKLPIFVARQWIRHRTASVNEYSGRYSILDREFYIPAREHLASQSTTNRQGRAGQLGDSDAERAEALMKVESERAYATYMWLLNEDENGTKIDDNREGVARELARIGLGLNTYTQWYWKIDLHNLLHFLRLRADAHAQFEIRVYAQAIMSILEKWVPLTFEAFVDYQLNAIALSAQAVEVLRRKLRGETVDFAQSGLSKREWEEVSAQFQFSR